MMAELVEQQDEPAAAMTSLEGSLQEDVLLHIFAQLAAEWSHDTYVQSPGRAAQAFVLMRTTLPLVCKRWASLCRSASMWHTIIISVSREVNGDKLSGHKGQRVQDSGLSTPPLGISPGSHSYSKGLTFGPANTPMGDSPRSYMPTSPHKGARSSMSISILRSERVLAWLGPRARACRALVLDISNPNHDFSSRTVQQLLSQLRPTLQVLHVLESPGQGRLEGYEVATLKNLQHVYVQGIPQDFLQLTMPYLCMLPALRLLHFKPDMASYPLPARLAQLPTSLQYLHLSKLWVEAFPAPYDKPCSGELHSPRAPSAHTAQSVAMLHEPQGYPLSPAAHPPSPLQHSSSASRHLPAASSSLSRSSQSLSSSTSSSLSSVRSVPGGLSTALQLNGSPRPHHPVHHSLCVVRLTECHLSPAVFVCLATSSLLQLHLHKCTLSEALGGLGTHTHSFGSLDLPGPSQLQALTLEACGIKEVQPALLQQLRELRELDLSRNEELGSTGLPHQMSCLVCLTRLDLSSCGLVSVPPAVAALPALHHLNLQLNALSALPKQFACEGSLQVADISCNRLTCLPPCLLTMTQLRHLVVSSGPVAGTPDFHTLHHRLPCLKLLQVKGCTYDCRAVRNLMQLSNSVEKARSSLVIDIVVQ